MYNNHKAVVLFSGGQDSTTVLALAVSRHGAENVYPISVYYGQRHSVEMECARNISLALGTNPIRSFEAGFLEELGSSALTSGRKDVDAPHEYDDALPASFVPNRNASFLVIGHAYAQKIGAKFLYGGMCETDFSGYPDCRDDFIKSINAALNIGAARSVVIETPLMFIDKAATFALADKLGALDLVIDESHTCYEGDHDTVNEWGYGCGKCPACKIRAEGYRKFVAGDL